MRVVLAAVVLLGLCTNAVQGSIVSSAESNGIVLSYVEDSYRITDSFELDFSFVALVPGTIDTIVGFSDPGNLGKHVTDLTAYFNFWGKNTHLGNPGGETFFNFNVAGWTDITPLVIPQPPYTGNDQQVSMAVGPLTDISTPLEFTMKFDSDRIDWQAPVGNWDDIATFFVAVFETGDLQGAWRIDVGYTDTSPFQPRLRIEPFPEGDFGTPGVVPEPASIAIWSVIGLVGVGMAYRRRRKSA